MKYFVLLFFLFSKNIFAQEESLFLVKGTQAPYSGFLIPEITANKLYKLNFEYKILEQKEAINEKLLLNKDSQLELLSKDNKNLSQEIAMIEKKNKINIILTVVGVSVGMVLLTFAVGYAIKTVERIPTQQSYINAGAF